MRFAIWVNLLYVSAVCQRRAAQIPIKDTDNLFFSFLTKQQKIKRNKSQPITVAMTRVHCPLLRQQRTKHPLSRPGNDIPRNGREMPLRRRSQPEATFMASEQKEEKKMRRPRSPRRCPPPPPPSHPPPIAGDGHGRSGGRRSLRRRLECIREPRPSRPGALPSFSGAAGST